MLWIRFSANINQKSFDRMASVIDNAMEEGITEVSILMTSGGGTTKIGTAFYNLFTTAPLSITAYNLGHIESAGIPAFLGAAKRFAIPTSMFLVHMARWKLNEKLNRHQLMEKAGILEREHQQYLDIMANSMLSDRQAIDQMLSHGRCLSPTEAKDHGIINEIETPQIPAGTRIYSILDE